MGTTENKFSSVIETVNNVPEEEIRKSVGVTYELLTADIIGILGYSDEDTSDYMRNKSFIKIAFENFDLETVVFKSSDDEDAMLKSIEQMMSRDGAHGKLGIITDGKIFVMNTYERVKNNYEAVVLNIEDEMQANDLYECLCKENCSREKISELLDKYTPTFIDLVTNVLKDNELFTLGTEESRVVSLVESLDKIARNRKEFGYGQDTETVSNETEVYDETLKNENKELKENLESLNSEKESLSQEISELKDKVEELNKINEESNKELEELREKNKSYEEKIAELDSSDNGTTESSSKELEELKEKYAKDIEEKEEQIRLLNSKNEGLEKLLNEKEENNARVTGGEEELDEEAVESITNLKVENEEMRSKLTEASKRNDELKERIKILSDKEGNYTERITNSIVDNKASKRQYVLAVNESLYVLDDVLSLVKYVIHEMSEHESNYEQIIFNSQKIKLMKDKGELSDDCLVFLGEERYYIELETTSEEDTIEELRNRMSMCSEMKGIIRVIGKEEKKVVEESKIVEVTQHEEVIPLIKKADIKAVKAIRVYDRLYNIESESLRESMLKACLALESEAIHKNGLNEIADFCKTDLSEISALFKKSSVEDNNTNFNINGTSYSVEEFDSFTAMFVSIERIANLMNINSSSFNLIIEVNDMSTIKFEHNLIDSLDFEKNDFKKTDRVADRENSINRGFFGSVKRNLHSQILMNNIIKGIDSIDIGEENDRIEADSALDGMIELMRNSNDIFDNIKKEEDKEGVSKFGTSSGVKAIISTEEDKVENPLEVETPKGTLYVNSGFGEFDYIAFMICSCRKFGVKSLSVSVKFNSEDVNEVQDLVNSDPKKSYINIAASEKLLSGSFRI